MLICADCKWGIAVYKREYKGVVLGCNNPNKKTYQGLGCFVRKETDNVDTDAEQAKDH